MNNTSVYALLPAIYPVEKAIVRLNPPVYASTSIISPAKNKPLISLDSIVDGFISLIETPPAVTIASLTGRGFETVSFIPFNSLTRFLLSDFVI